MDVKLDMKLQLVKAKYKLEGIGFVDMLYRTIYDEGYFIKLDDDNKILLVGEFGISEERFDEMLDFCLEKEIFYKPLYDEHRVLTSGGVQRRYFHRTTRRKEQVTCQYVIPDVLAENPELADSIEVIADNNNGKSNNKYTKKRKEKNIKEKKRKHLDSVFLLDAEHKKLIEEYGEEFTKACIKKLDDYKVSKGKRYKSDYRAILNWVVDAVKEKNGGSTKKKPLIYNEVWADEYTSTEFNARIGQNKYSNPMRQELQKKYFKFDQEKKRWVRVEVI